jgi:outer membrane receptor protein involved in Fe transport
MDKPGSGNSPLLIRNAYLTNAYIHMHENEKEKLKLAYSNYLDTTGEISAAMALNEMYSIKPNYVPSHVPFVEANPYVFIYQLPSQQIDFNYKPLPITPVALNNTNRNYGEARNNFIKIGAGNYRTTHAEIGYDLSQDVNKELYLSYVHRASKSSNFIQQASQNQLRLLSHNKSNRFDFNSALTVERNVYRPYGALESAVSAEARNRFLDINILSNIKPLVNLIKGVETKGTIGAGLYNINSDGGDWSGSELSFIADVPFSKTINEKTTAGLGLEVQANGLVGGSDKPTNINTGSSFVVFKPTVTKQVDDINVTLGLNVALAKNIAFLPNASVSKFSPLLNAKAEVGVESELVANSYKQLSQVNPFISLVNLEQTKRTLYYGQLTGAILDNINYNLKIGGGKVKNLPLYINDTNSDRSFDVWYEKNATIFSLQANVEYQLNYKTNAGLQLRYEPLLNKESFDKAFHYVPMQANLFAKYTLMDRLALRGDLFLRSGTDYLVPANSQADGKLAGAFDLNLRADYQLNNKWNLFLELNNLLNNQYNRWYNYPNYGLNALGGLVYSFNKSVRSSKNNAELK